jgi:hypothetical protein
MGAVEGALSYGLTLDAVRFDEPEDQIRRSPQYIDQALTIGLPHNTNHVIRHEPEAGIDQSHIASGTTKTDFSGFENNGIPARLRQMQCGGQAGISAADDGDIDAMFPLDGT